MTPDFTCRNCGAAYDASSPAAARCPRCGYAEVATMKSPMAATSTDRVSFSAPVSQPVHAPHPQAGMAPVASMPPTPAPLAPVPPTQAPIAPYGMNGPTMPAHAVAPYGYAPQGAPMQHGMHPMPHMQPMPMQPPAYAPQPQPYGMAPYAPQPIVVIQNQVNAPYGAAPYAMAPYGYVKRKDAGVAALISFFLPGGGQLYNGQVGKGLAFLAVTVVNFCLLFVGIGFLTGIATWIWSMVDAHQSAERINRGEIVV